MTLLEFSCYPSFQPSVLFKTAYKAVVNLKHRIHDNSRGDYYPQHWTFALYGHVVLYQTDTWLCDQVLEKRFSRLDVKSVLLKATLVYFFTYLALLVCM